MRATNERLTILSEDEQFALYEIPDFDEEQRQYYLQFTEFEQDIIYKRKSLSDKLYCAIQIGYFKAKQIFFDLTWDNIPEDDCLYVLEHYLPDITWTPEPVSRHEFYLQRSIIITHFGFQNWKHPTHKPLLLEQIANIIKRDTDPSFILPELICWLNKMQIIRPGYTTLQTIISRALTDERERLAKIVKGNITNDMQNQLDILLSTDNMISDLAALKQDAKDFKYRIMQAECDKLKILKPLYKLAKTLLPVLSISQQNINYYSSLAHFYTVYQLREFKPEQRNLYLLCYAWHRYQQVTDNLTDAFCYHIKHFDDFLKLRLQKHRTESYRKQRKQAKKVSKLLRLFIDDKYEDETPYGNIRKIAFKILSKEQIEALSLDLAQLSNSEQEITWNIFDKDGFRFRRYLRPLFINLDLDNNNTDNNFLLAIQIVKERFSKQQHLPLKESALIDIIPKGLQPYLLLSDKNNNKILHVERYEYWLYRQCREKILNGELCLDDSNEHRSFDSELITPEKEQEIFLTSNIANFNQPLSEIIDKLIDELENLWITFNRKLRKGEFKHLEYDKFLNQLIVRKVPEIEDEDTQFQFYKQLSPCNIINLLQFVNEKCEFLKTLTPLQSRYSKKYPIENELFAVLIAYAMNHGINTMADVSNIPYHTLFYNYKQYFRENTLQKANDILSAATSKLPIFPYYENGLSVRFGAVDGQKFSVNRPTMKARHSKKYFGRGRGVVAYTLLCNHIPLKSRVISAHNHESYYVFDIVYNNSSTIIPEAITGDMHSVNKANFIILFWFGILFNPRFTDIVSEISKVCGTKDEQGYTKFLIKPEDTFDRN
jgi:hypothetical protein